MVLLRDPITMESQRHVSRYSGRFSPKGNSSSRIVRKRAGRWRSIARAAREARRIQRSRSPSSGSPPPGPSRRNPDARQAQGQPFGAGLDACPSPRPAPDVAHRNAGPAIGAAPWRIEFSIIARANCSSTPCAIVSCCSAGPTSRSSTRTLLIGAVLRTRQTGVGGVRLHQLREQAGQRMTGRRRQTSPNGAPHSASSRWTIGSRWIPTGAFRPRSSSPSTRSPNSAACARPCSGS